MSDSASPKQNARIYHAPDVRVEPFPNLANSAMGGITAPIHPPHRFNDDTLMYVAVRIGQTPGAPKDNKPSSSKSSSRLKSFTKALKRSASCSSAALEDIRMIRMPRRDYIKYFARNEFDEYVGTEPEKSWNDEDLEEAFGRYRDFKPTRWVMKEDGDSKGKSSALLVPGKEVFVAAEVSEKGDGGRLLNEG